MEQSLSFFLRTCRRSLPGRFSRRRDPIICHGGLRQCESIAIKFNAMIALEPITPQNAMVFKAVRLQALQDTPSAFGSTYAKESQLTDADWIKRALQWNSERSAAFLAMDEHTACGIVGSFLDQDDATRAHLVSMWTAPTHRRRGIGRLLVNEVLGWARVREARLGQGQPWPNLAEHIIWRVAFYKRSGASPYAGCVLPNRRGRSFCIS